MFPKRKIFASALLATTLLSASAFATTPAVTTDGKLTGLWLTTDFPSIMHSVGDDITIDLHMENRNLPPQNVKLDVKGLPEGWKWQFKGEGDVIQAATVRPDQQRDVTLDIDPPQNAKAGSYVFEIAGMADGQNFTVPVTLQLTEAAAAKVTLEPKLPAMRGAPTSTFEYQLTAKNDSREDQTFNLLAQVPPGFEGVFTEQYGSNELTSIPIKAGESKELKVKVTPPRQVAAGQYPVKVAIAAAKLNATTDLMLHITGKPGLTLTSTDGRLSGEATAGAERSFNFTVMNDGTAPTEAVKLNATPPSGWKITFAPEKIDALKPGEKTDVAVNLTPSDKAITGDYMVNIRADGEGASDNAEFRVTVKTSTVWGIAGLGIIAASLAAFGGAVTRYGRR